MHPVIRVVREHFDHSGLTQQKVAEKIGTTQSAVSDMLSSDSNPKLSTLTRLCEAFDLQLAVIGVDDKPEPEIIERETRVVPRDVMIKITYTDEGMRAISVEEEA